MKIIEITPLENGGHRNQTINGVVKLPEGWAVIPDGMPLENFPFGELTTTTIDGVVTVSEWIPGVMPEKTPEVEFEKTPTATELLNIILGVSE